MSGEIDVSKVDLTQLTNNHLSGCGSFCSVCCPSGLASEFHECSVNIFSLVTVTYAKQIWDEMICPKDTKEEESLQASCDCNRGEEQELMRPDFRRGELNEGQVEMKVDDDAHSIVPESTSAYVRKNSVTTSGPSDILLQQLLRLVTVQGCLLALCTLRRYSSSPDGRHDAD